MEKREINICDVCEEIFAGGDAPKDRFSETKTDDFSVPIYSNGEANSGLYGYTNFSRVNVPSITVSARGTIGYTTIRHEPFVPIVRLITLVPKTDVIDINYLYYATQNYKFVNNGTSIPQLTVPMLKRYSFPLPSMEQQKKIADEFDKVTVLIDKRKRQLEKFDELVKSRFIEMFGDPVVNPKSWETAPLSTLIINANNGMARRGKDEDGSIVLRLVELQNGFIDYSTPNRICLNETEKKRYELVDNDFLFARVNGNPDYVGRCAVFKSIDEPVFHNDHIIRVHFDETKINGFFMSVLLNSDYGKRQMREQIKTSAGQYTISQDGIGAIMAILPPLELQEQFAAFVKQVDKSKFEIKQSLEKLELLKKSLMQKYFG